MGSEWRRVRLGDLARIEHGWPFQSELFSHDLTGRPIVVGIGNFDYSGALTEAVLLGTVAYRVGKRLEWDAVGLKATNCPETDRYIRRPYRDGWTLNRERRCYP